MGGRGRNNASRANQTSHYGIMGGLAPSNGEQGRKRYMLNRAINRHRIPLMPIPGLKLMKDEQLLSVNPTSSGGIGLSKVLINRRIGPCGGGSNRSNRKKHLPAMLSMLETAGPLSMREPIDPTWKTDVLETLLENADLPDLIPPYIYLVPGCGLVNDPSAIYFLLYPRFPTSDGGYYEFAEGVAYYIHSLFTNEHAPWEFTVRMPGDGVAPDLFQRNTYSLLRKVNPDGTTTTVPTVSAAVLRTTMRQKYRAAAFGCIQPLTGKGIHLSNIAIGGLKDGTVSIELDIRWDLSTQAYPDIKISFALPPHLSQFQSTFNPFQSLKGQGIKAPDTAFLTGIYLDIPTGLNYFVTTFCGYGCTMPDPPSTYAFTAKLKEDALYQRRQDAPHLPSAISKV